MTPSIEIDKIRAELVVQRVHEAFKQGKGLLAETADLVENQIPNGVTPLSKEHALFLFYIVANDHGMKSSRLYTQAKKLFAEHKELYAPKYVIDNFSSPDDPKLIEMTGKYLGTRYPKETAKSWFLNSQELLDKYDGDARKLLTSTQDAKVLIKRIKAFRGYGPKIGGMFLRAAIGLGFAKVSGIDEVLVPVDIHDSRISFLTGIVRDNKNDKEKLNYYDYVTQVQKILLNTCNSLNLEWLDTDRALWLIGSRGCVNKRCVLCPLSDLCEVGQVVTQNIQTETSSISQKTVKKKKSRSNPEFQSAVDL